MGGDACERSDLPRLHAACVAARTFGRAWWRVGKAGAGPLGGVGRAQCWAECSAVFANNLCVSEGLSSQHQHQGVREIAVVPSARDLPGSCSDIPPPIQVVADSAAQHGHETKRLLNGHRSPLPAIFQTHGAALAPPLPPQVRAHPTPTPLSSRNTHSPLGALISADHARPSNLHCVSSLGRAGAAGCLLRWLPKDLQVLKRRFDRAAAAPPRPCRRLSYAQGQRAALRRCDRSCRDGRPPAAAGRGWPALQGAAGLPAGVCRGPARANALRTQPHPRSPIPQAPALPCRSPTRSSPMAACRALSPRF